MGTRSFLVVQENVLNQAENDQFEHHQNYADLHLLVEGHEYSSYGSRIKDEASSIRRSKWHWLCALSWTLPLLWGCHNFAIFFPGEPHQSMAMQIWKRRFANISLKFWLIKKSGGANMAQKGKPLSRAAFDTDNFLMRFVEKVLDIVTANLLLSSLVCPSWRLSELKLVSTRLCLRLRRGRRVPVFKIYLRAFKLKSETRSSVGSAWVGHCLIKSSRPLSLLGSDSYAFPNGESYLSRRSYLPHYRDVG